MAEEKTLSAPAAKEAGHHKFKLHYPDNATDAEVKLLTKGMDQLYSEKIARSEKSDLAIKTASEHFTQALEQLAKTAGYNDMKQLVNAFNKECRFVAQPSQFTRTNMEKLNHEREEKFKTFLQKLKIADKLERLTGELRQQIEEITKANHSTVGDVTMITEAQYRHYSRYLKEEDVLDGHLHLDGVPGLDPVPQVTQQTFMPPYWGWAWHTHKGGTNDAWTDPTWNSIICDAGTDANVGANLGVSWLNSGNVNTWMESVMVIKYTAPYDCTLTISLNYQLLGAWYAYHILNNSLFAVVNLSAVPLVKVLVGNNVHQLLGAHELNGDKMTFDGIYPVTTGPVVTTTNVYEREEILSDPTVVYQATLPGVSFKAGDTILIACGVNTNAQCNGLSWLQTFMHDRWRINSVNVCAVKV